MFTKILLFAFIAACGGQTNSASNPDEPGKAPPEQPVVEDQHFCCQSVDPKTKTGDGCVTIAQTQIDRCAKVLYCPGFWAKDDGTVTCD